MSASVWAAFTWKRIVSSPFGTTGTIELEASGSATMKAPSIEIKADATAELASANTTVKGDGMTTIKGGMVMIN